MGDTAAAHWDRIYRGKAADGVSWFQQRPAVSLRLLAMASSRTGSVIDVGAGASTLVDALLDAGWSDITLLDVSHEALAAVVDRLGVRSRAISFVVADLLVWKPERTYAAWHDRAVFHFLVRPGDRARYIELTSRAISAGGVLVLGLFDYDGPTRCSGLPTARYDADSLVGLFAPAFALVHHEQEDHVTPSGTVQPFTWVVLRRM